MKREDGYYWVRSSGIHTEDWEIFSWSTNQWWYADHVIYDGYILEIDERRIVRENPEQKENIKNECDCANATFCITEYNEYGDPILYCWKCKCKRYE